MIGRIEKQTKYGVGVQVNTLMEHLRPSECLCLNCANLRPGNHPDNCRIAEKLYAICLAENVALAITRCPIFAPKGSAPKEGSH